MTKPLTPDVAIARTRCWIERAVIAFNLCPFAGKPYAGEQVRYVVSEAREPEHLLEDLQRELEHLRATDPKEVETTVLIHPRVLQDFLDYNDFLDLVDALLEQGGYEEEFQVAGLHPDYQFAGTEPEDAENYTNRSPYPILHLLRVEGVARAIAAYTRPEQIPERNIERMEELGAERMRALLDDCMRINEPD
ncbi:MAG: DUF1415 domain-containing protein [Pseudomonadota bacterium]